MIKFKELKIKNFRSYEQFSWSDVDQMGLTLISGENGTGKSTIRHAIEYLLLDRISDEIAVDDLPLNGNTNCKLECILEMPNRDEVRIVKYRNDSTHGNKIIVSVNGDDSLTTTDRRITKRNIDKLLGLTPELVFSSTIFSSKSPSFVECSEKDRKDILYNFIDREKYTKLWEITRKKLTNLESAIRGKMNEIDTNSVKKDAVENNIIELNENEKYYLKKIQSQIEQLKSDKLEIVFNDPAELQEVIDGLKQALTKPDLEKYQQFKDKLDELKNEELEIKELMKSYNLKIDSVRNNNCPVIDRECEYLEDRCVAILDEFKPKLEALDDELQELKSAQEGVQYEIDRMDQEIGSNRDIEQRLKYLIERQGEQEQYNKQIDTMHDRIDKQIKELEDSLNTNQFQKMRDTASLELERLTDLIEEEKKQLHSLLREQEYLNYWETGYGRSGIPNMKMESVLESLESETNNYLSKISESIFVEIDAQKELKTGGTTEKISYLVHHPDKHIKNYNSYSGGERQRVKLSDIFAFNTLLGKFNIMILDEVLEGSIDDKGKSQIIALLREKSKELGSLFVISHDDYIKDSFDNVVYTSKQNGISRTTRKATI